MKIVVQIPSVLRPECRGAKQLAVEATTVSGVLKQLEAHHPALYRSVCDETGAVRIHVNLFVNANFIRRPQDLETLLSEGDQVSIMPAVSGG